VVGVLRSGLTIGIQADYNNNYINYFTGHVTTVGCPSVANSIQSAQERGIQED